LGLQPLGEQYPQIPVIVKRRLGKYHGSRTDVLKDWLSHQGSLYEQGETRTEKKKEYDGVRSAQATEFPLRERLNF